MVPNGGGILVQARTAEPDAFEALHVKDACAPLYPISANRSRFSTFDIIPNSPPVAIDAHCDPVKLGNFRHC